MPEQTTTGFRDVRRPREMSDLLGELTDGGHPFPTMRDALVFAASLGWARDKRVPFENSAEPIRWGTMTNRLGTEDLVNMLATAATEDPEVLAAGRESERLEIFEEYANGGLQVIQQIMREQPARQLASLLVELARAGLQTASEGTDLPPELGDLAKRLL